MVATSINTEIFAYEKDQSSYAWQANDGQIGSKSDVNILKVKQINSPFFKLRVKCAVALISLFPVLCG